MSFSKDLDRAYNKKVVQATNVSISRTAIKAIENLIATTPVDTGLARRNWLTSVSMPRDDIREDNITNPQVAVTEALSTLTGYNAFVDGDIWISNNLPYIEELNRGSSVKAPAGFVEAEVNSAARFVQQVFRDQQK